MIIADLFARLTFGRAVITGALICVFYYFVMFDSGEQQKQAIIGAQTQIAAVNKDIADVQGKLDRAREFQTATQELGHSIKRLLEFIPSGFTMGDFMKVVSTEARVSGLQIQRITPVPELTEQSVPEFKELGVTLELQGQYSQVLKFMASLTQKKQIFIYDTLQMSQVSDGGDNGLITVSADIRAYEYIGTPAVPVEGGDPNAGN